MSVHTRATRRFGVVALVISLAACGQHDTIPVSPVPTAPATPAPQPPPSARPAVTVSGRVLEFTAAGERRPVPNLRLKVLAGGPNTGAVSGIELDDIVTDAEGRYTITDVAALVLYFQTAPGSDYRFLCEAYAVWVGASAPPPYPDFSRDLAVVHVGWSIDRLPTGMLSGGGTSVYGVVSERVDGSVRPLSGVRVTLDGGIQDPPATTNESGFYMVCSVVGTDQSRTITAFKSGYDLALRDILGGSDYEVNLGLTRR